MVINTMRNAAAILWLVVITVGGAGALTTNPERAHLHAESIRSMYPRLESSPGERALLDYIEGVVAELGLDASVADFNRLADGHSFSRSIEVVAHAAGGAQAAGTVIIATPINHRPGAAPDDDGAASIAAALTLLEAVAANPTAVTHRFLFLGAEFRDEASDPLGSRRFLSDYFPEGPHVLAYLNVSRLPFRLETGGGGAVAPSWAIADTVAAAARVGFDVAVRANLNQVHRLGVSGGPAALARFLQAGIPGVFLESGDVGLRSPDVGSTARQLTSFLAEWTDTYRDGVPDTWDRHYLYFQAGDRQIVVGERFFIVILITVILVTLLYALVFRRRFARYVRTIGRNLWNLPLLFLLVFGFLTAGTYLINLFLLVRRFPTMWEYYPGAFIALKVLLAVLLFTIAGQLLRYLPLSKNGSFYSAAALFVLFIDIIIFSALNISFGHYFIWAYVAAFFFSVARGRILKGVSLALAPVLLVFAAVEVISIPELRFARAILLSTEGDLLLSFVTLPFLLMLIRLDFMIRHPIRGRKSFALRTVSWGAGIGVAAVVAFVTISSPFSSIRSQPLRVTEIVDYPNLERSLTLTSIAPIGSIEVNFAGQTYSTDTRDRSWSVQTPSLPDVLSARLVYSQFLDRDRATLTIDAPQPLERIQVLFSSDSPIILFDANFPFSISSDQRSAEIFVGTRPALPLTIEYTIGGVAPGIDITAESLVHPEPLEVAGRRFEVDTELLIRTRFGR